MRNYGDKKFREVDGFTDWKPFIDNTQNELNEIERIGSDCYINLDNVVNFYARLKGYMSSRWSYVRIEITVDKENKELRGVLKRRLNEIGRALMTPQYMKKRSARANNRQGDYAAYEITMIKMLDDLFDILEQISSEFRYMRLLYNPDQNEEPEVNEFGRGAAV